MNQRGIVLAASALIFANALTACSVPPQEYNTQRFDAGEATCLSGKQLHFINRLLSIEKITPFGNPERYVSDQANLPVDPADHEVIDLFLADPFELTLPENVVVRYYDHLYETLYIGSDGTIAFGTPGTGNSNLVDAFGSDQISLLPVDATIEGTVVRYAITDDKVVITYENVGGSTFQCELFYPGDRRLDIIVSYSEVSEFTRSGVVGIPDREHPNLLRSNNVTEFLDRYYLESNLCEDSPFNPL